MSTINFCETKEQLNHLGEVVTGKTNGSPSGADIETSTLPYTGQVRNTLPALEELYLGEINEFIQESDQVITDKTAELDDAVNSFIQESNQVITDKTAELDDAVNSFIQESNQVISDKTDEFDTSIASKEAEASAAIDSYRLLSKGDYSSGILLSNKFEFVEYNGESYFAVNPPYTTTETTPDADSNLFISGYTTFENVANKIGNKNELSNSNFITPSPEDITHPNATPESYVAGTQIFSGVYAGDSGCTVTFTDGRVNCASGDYKFKLSNSGGLERVPAFTSSVSDYDGIPKTTGVSHALVGDEHIVTVTPAAGNVFSVKFEQGSVSTRHEVGQNPEEAANAGDSLVAGGLIFPQDNSLLSLGIQSTVVNVDATRFNVDNTGSGGEQLYFWELSGTLPSSPFIIENIVEVAFGNYDFTINGVVYQFVTKKSEKYRFDNDPRGWGFFGPSIDGLTNRTTLQRKAQHTIDTGEPIYIPTLGDYTTIGDNTTTGTQINLSGATKDILIYGDGVTSKLRRGDGTVANRFDRFFFIGNQSGSQINVQVKSLNIDDNATGNPLSGGDLFEFQNAHLFSVDPVGYRGVIDVNYDDIYCIDPIADVCNAGGSSVNTIKNYIANNVRVFGRTRTRFDVGATCSFDSFKSTNCDIDRFTIEVNSASNLDNGVIQLTNLNTRVMTILWPPVVGETAPTAQLSNCKAKFIDMQGLSLVDNGGDYELGTTLRFVGFGSSQDAEYSFIGTKITAASDFVNVDGAGLTYIATTATSPTRVSFDGDYLLDDNGLGFRCFTDSNAGIEGKIVSFGKGVMKSATDRCCNVRSGNFSFKGVDYECDANGAMVYQDAMTAAAPALNTMDIMRCTANSSSFVYRMPASGNQVNVRMQGNIPQSADKHLSNVRSDRLIAPFGTGSLILPLNLDTLQQQSITTPTFTAIKGTKVEYLGVNATGDYMAIASDSLGGWRTFP